MSLSCAFNLLIKVVAVWGVAPASFGQRKKYYQVEPTRHGDLLPQRALIFEVLSLRSRGVFNMIFQPVSSSGPTSYQILSKYQHPVKVTTEGGMQGVHFFHRRRYQHLVKVTIGVSGSSYRFVKRRDEAYLDDANTPNLPTNIVDFTGFDSNIILI